MHNEFIGSAQRSKEVNFQRIQLGKDFSNGLCTLTSCWMFGYLSLYPVHSQTIGIRKGGVGKMDFALDRG